MNFIKLIDVTLPLMSILERVVTYAVLRVKQRKVVTASQQTSGSKFKLQKILIF